MFMKGLFFIALLHVVCADGTKTESGWTNPMTWIMNAFSGTENNDKICKHFPDDCTLCKETKDVPGLTFPKASYPKDDLLKKEKQKTYICKDAKFQKGVEFYALHLAYEAKDDDGKSVIPKTNLVNCYSKSNKQKLMYDPNAKAKK